MDIIALIGLGFKVFLAIRDDIKDSPAEERREVMAKWDQAVSKLRKEKKIGDLTKWLASRL